MSAAEAEPIAARSSAKEESEEKAEERRGILGRDVERLEAAFAVDSTVTSDSAGENAGETEELVRLREALRGFRMPAEWEPHDGCWMIWPERPDNWRDAAVPAQQAFAAVAACISRFEPVRMLVSGAQVRARADRGRGEKGGEEAMGERWAGQGRGGRNEEGRVGCEREWRNARQQLPASVRVIEMSSNDAWARDICPTFVVKDLPGGEQHVLRVGVMHQMAELIPTCMRHRTSLVMEGGSLHVDGEGTLITTAQCLLHHSRNPALSRAAIEDHLCALLGVSAVIWLPRGLQGDEDTDGHVDNLACFVAPAHVLLAWTDDPSHPQYPVCQAAYEVLCLARDAKNRPLRITHLPLPPSLHYSHQDVQGLAQEGAHAQRQAGDLMAASYINFYLPNGAVVAPAFGIPSSDQRAFEVLQKVFPLRESRSAMATQNPFALLDGDDNDDPQALLSRVAAEPVKVDASKKAGAKGAKPAPAAAKPAAATTAPARSGYNRGGRGGGRGGYGGRGGDYQTFNEPRDNGRAFIAERQVRGEDGENRTSFDQHHHGDLRRGGGRGGRGRGYGRDGGQRRPHREFDRMSGTGRGGEIKREGAGRGNWGREGEYLGDETVAPASGEAEPKAEGEAAEAAAEVAAPEPPVLSEEELAAQEAARKEKEEEEKQMTLEEYEKVLEEKRKALAASKAAARVVELDEEMAKMTLKKKPEGDDVFVKL
ncbi:unnamed protein product, partial [Closterium sp. NIES-65]